ncbi:MAG TPA: hypothetical protein VGN00_09205 [Puia sp.]|jgi:hypothetical protein
MLQHLVYFLLISAICCIWGIPLFLLTGLDKKETPWYRSAAGLLAFLFISGCLTISFFASWLYLFLPLRLPLLLALTLALLLIGLFFCRPRIILLLEQIKNGFIFLPRAGQALLFISGLLFLALSCLPPNNGDTQIYHLQVIQWENGYRAIPGIANLFLRTGLGSNWFGLISLFQLPFFPQENYSYLNFSLAIWSLIWLLSSWHYHFRRLSSTPGSYILCLFYFLVMLYAFFDWGLFRDTANSTNYDFIVTITTLLAISFLLEGIWQPLYHKDFSAAFLFITLSVIAFKFSGIFILLPVAYHLFQHRSSRRILLSGLFSLLIFTPVLLRNYIITGYPLFPLSFSPGSPDWQVPKAMVDLLHNYIILSNRFLSQDFTNSYAFRNEHAFWLPFWFRGLSWLHRVTVLLILSSLLLFKYAGFPAEKQRLRHYTLLLLFMTAGWFFTAPAPRLGYGILLAAAVLPVSVWFGPKIKTSWYILSLWGTAAILCFYLPFKFSVMVRHSSVWLQPQTTETPSYSVVENGNIGFHLPDKINENNDHRCYDIALPCICELNPWLQPRGPFLSDGFRMLPPDSVFIQNYNY